MSSNIATNRLLIESEIEIAFKNALKTQKLELISKPYLSSTSSRGLLPSQVGSANTSDSESEDYYYMTVICDNLLLYYSPNGAGPTNSKRSNNILTEINLSYNALSVLSFQLLLQTLTDLQISSLKVLQFNHCQLIKDHCIILKYFLLSIRSLERLSVSSNQISNYGLQILSEAFLFDQDHLNSTSSATTALLSKTLISGTTQPQGGRAGLGGDGKPSTSSSSPMSITAANIQQHFPTLPPNSDNSVFTLEELDLSDNSIQDSGILSFCRACLYYNKKLLTMKSISSNLKRLFFNHNQITDKGIYCLAQLLNSKLTSNSGNITNSTKPQLLPPNRFGINLEEISFKQNPHITSHGIICLLGNNHLTTNPTNNTNNNALANTPTDQFHNHLTLYTNVMTCCIHQTLKHINFNECHLSLLIFQYLIPMISKGAFQTLETIHLEFSKNNSLEIIENSSKHYNKIYGNHLSTVKSVSSLSSNSINNYSSNPTSNSPHSSIVMSYCFQLLVDALLGINHKYRVSIKSIFLGQLPNIIFEQCITAKKKLQQYQQPSPNKEIIDYQNIYEDCRKSLEFMNPASEFFHISYISNIEHWLKAEQYHNALYTTTPLLSVFSQVTSPDGKKAASTNVSPLKGRNQQIPPKHPDTSQSKSLPKSSTSPFKGVSRGLDKSGRNAVDSQYQSPTKEKSSDKDQKPRMPTPSFSPDLLDRRRSGGRSSSPQRVASRAKQAPSRSASPTKRLGGTSQAEVKNKSKNDQGSSQRDEEVDDSDDWISTTRSQQLRASQDIPEIDESEISELPPHHLKKLQQEQTNAVHTLSTEIQKLLRVTTPAAIHVLSSKQQEEEDEAKKEDTTLVTSSVYSNALTVTTGNQKEGNKITILDPYEIEKANIASQLYLQQSMANANSAADIDQSFFQQQSLMSHDIQYELYNLTESLNQITEVKKEPKAVKDSTKGQKGKNSDLVVRSSSNSPTRVRRSNSSSPTRYSNNNNGYSKESINQYITKQITQYFEARYQKEIEAMQAAMINIANHYSKLDYRFQQFYEKKVMTKLMEFENRLIEMENRQVAFLTAAGMSLNPSQRLNERFIENLAHSTLQGPALNEFRQHFNQQQQQNQNLPSSNESFIGVSDSNPAVAPPSRNSNAALQQLQYRLDLLEQKLQVMTAPNPDPATETINSIKENSYYYPQDDRVQEESFVHRVTTATYSTAPENSLIQPTNLSEMDLDYKHQLLRQLSSLDAEIAREKSETFEVNHQNILLLQQHQHHYNSTSRAPTPSFYPVISSRSTSPLSTSNAPTPFPGFQDPSSTYNHYLNQDQQQNHQQNLQPTNFDQNYHYLDVSTDGFDTSFVPSALSNINRFERIAALHASFNDQHFHSIDPPQSISSYPNVNHAQDERNSDNQRNNRRLSTNSNTSSNNEQKRSKTPVKSQPAPSSSTTQSVIPEYYYDTLLPDHYYNSNNVSENTIKRGSSTHTHQVADKQGKSNQVPPQSTLQPAVSHNHHPPQKGYMQATRSAYHKRNVPTQHH